MGTKFTPTPIVVRTALDEQGSLLDVSRIPGEDLHSYSERLFDAYSRRASSTYEGLLNGINRELNIDRKELIEVRIRGIGIGDITAAEILATETTITDNTIHSNIIDGTSVIAIGGSLTDSTQTWTPTHLRGKTLVIDGMEYKIVDNTETEVQIKESLSELIGQSYSISPGWEDGALVGLGLEMGSYLFRIEENTENIIRIESGDILRTGVSEYRLRAFNPKIEATASKLSLYKEFSNNENFQLEKEIDLRDEVEFHKDIVSIINSLTFFEASDLLGERDDVLSVTINRQSSEKDVIKEIVPVSKFFKLANKNIKEGSVRFTEAGIFLREVEEEDVSMSEGNYSINYNQGVVKVNTVPSGKRTVSYSWNFFPFIITNSLAIINPLNKGDSQEFLFLQKEMEIYDSPSEHFKSSVPKADMIEYIAELLAVKPSNWGA